MPGWCDLHAPPSDEERQRDAAEVAALVCVLEDGHEGPCALFSPEIERATRPESGHVPTCRKAPLALVGSPVAGAAWEALCDALATARGALQTAAEMLGQAGPLEAAGSVGQALALVELAERTVAP